MALLRSVLGTVTQSMGGVTATTWKGKNVLKQKVAATNTSNTPAQQLQRSKFAALATLGGLFGPAIRIGFRVAAAKVTEQNAFYTANKAAVTSVNGVVSVDYTALKLSTGIVGGVMALDAQLTPATGKLTVSWDDNTNGTDALMSDEINILAFNKLTNQASLMGVDKTRNGTSAELTADFLQGASPANIVVYAFFKRFSNTSSSPSTAVIAHA